MPANEYFLKDAAANQCMHISRRTLRWQLGEPVVKTDHHLAPSVSLAPDSHFAAQGSELGWPSINGD